jgi:AcrR family transcriptional regulator
MPPSPDRSPRKQPQQNRSRLMRDRILSASLRVLADEGALGFTTTRVADEAGISVGSLYQYFPNKHALVLALHDADISQGWEYVQAILDRPLAPRQKIGDIVEWFFVTESKEVAELGAVGGDIHVFLRESVNNPELSMLIHKTLAAFVAASSTVQRSKAELQFAADFAFTLIESLGKAVAPRGLNQQQLKKWARMTASMLCDSLNIV